MAVVSVACALPAAPIVPGVEAAQALDAIEKTLRPTPVPILSRTEVRDDFNQFALSYATGDGISVAQQGALKALPSEDGELQNVLVVRGSYAYYGPDGKLYKVSYVADENGMSITKDFCNSKLWLTAAVGAVDCGQYIAHAYHAWILFIQYSD